VAAPIDNDNFIPCLFAKSMNSMEMDQKFQEGQKLWDDGNEEEGAEIWANLALLTHLGSATVDD
jgi:hypothetical protein